MPAAIQAVSEYVFGKYCSFVAETRGLLTMPPNIFNCLFCSVNDLRSVLRRERTRIPQFCVKKLIHNSRYYTFILIIVMSGEYAKKKECKLYYVSLVSG